MSVSANQIDDGDHQGEVQLWHSKNQTNKSTWALPPNVAVLDIVLVFVVFHGDVKLS